MQLLHLLLLGPHHARNAHFAKILLEPFSRTLHELAEIFHEIANRMHAREMGMLLPDAGTAEESVGAAVLGQADEILRKGVPLAQPLSHFEVCYHFITTQAKYNSLYTSHQASNRVETKLQFAPRVLLPGHLLVGLVADYLRVVVFWMMRKIPK